MRWFVLVACMGLASVGAFGQSANGSSTVMVGAGVGGGQSVDGSGLTLKGNYEYRLTRHLAVEGGMEILFVPMFFPVYASISAGQNLSGYFPQVITFSDKRNAHAVQIPFGLKGILPFRNDRVELFGGLGAIAVANKPSASAARWLAQVSMGGRIAVDKNRHIWVGATGRGFTDFVNPAASGQQHYTVTAELGFRFGR